MGERLDVREINRRRWRRLLVGVVCISSVLGGAAFDAVRNAHSTAGGGFIRRETVVFTPAEPGPDSNPGIVLQK